MSVSVARLLFHDKDQIQSMHETWFKESDKIVREIDSLRSKANVTRVDRDRQRELEDQLSALRDSYIVATKESDMDADVIEMGDAMFPEKVFRNYASPLYTMRSDTTCTASASRGSIQLSAPQMFLRKFFSHGSQRGGILLFHAVGTGKTCTAITIAEEFANAGQRVIVLTPRSLLDQFKNQVFDTSSLTMDKDTGLLDKEKSASRQCTKDAYILRSAASPSTAINDVNLIARRIDRSIRQRYDINTFHGLLRTVLDFEDDAKRRISANNEPAVEAAVDARIREHYSNSLIIIDEVHNLRNMDDSKPISEALMRVVRCAVNIRLVLLTATPMYNSAPDALWILNLLRANDKRTLIDEKSVFEVVDTVPRVTKKGAALLAKAASGYVSYVGSTSTPELFPKVIDAPSRHGDPRRLEYHGLVLTASEMREPQASACRKKHGLMHDIKQSNVVFPGSPDNKLDDVFEVMQLPGNKSQYRYRPNVPKFLESPLLIKHAAKMATIIEAIEKAEGLVFVYSMFLDQGLTSLAMALEHAGFTRKFNRPMLHPSCLTPNRTTQNTHRKYAILSGTNEVSDDMNAVLADFKSDANADGSIIKVLLGSEVVAEGIDLKNVRQVHVLEPWWHMKKIKQVIGRAARRCSHVALPKDKRNVECFLHAAVFAKSVEESIDLQRYKLSVKKDEAIAAIEKILAATAVDRDMYSPMRLAHVNSKTDEEFTQMIISRIDAAVPMMLKEEKSPAIVELQDVVKKDLYDAFSKTMEISDLVEISHRALTERAEDYKYEYVAQVGAFVHGAPRSESYKQIRERIGDWKRPSCIKTRFSINDVVKEKRDESGTYEEVLQSLGMMKIKVTSNVREMFKNPARGAKVADSLSQQIIDHIVDSITHPELLVLFDRYLGPHSPSIRAGTDNGVPASMLSAGYLVSVGDDRLYGYDFFASDNVYYKSGGEHKVTVEPYEFASVIAPIVMKEMEANKIVQGSLKGFMSFIATHLPFEFKTSKISSDGKWTRGTVCSSSIMVKDELIQMLTLVDPSITDDEIDKSNGNKPDICTFIELLLRKAGNGAFTRCRHTSKMA